MRQRENLLFYEESLYEQLQTRQKRAAGTVDEIPQQQLLISTDEQLIAYVEARLRVEPVELHEEARSMRQEECQIDVSGDPRRHFRHDRRGPFYIPGTRVAVTIPFTGEAWIFRYRTSSYWSVFPHGDVKEARGGQPSQLTITIEQTHDTDQEQFKKTFEDEVDLIHGYIGYAKNEVEAYNSQLPGVIRSLVQHRRQRLEQHKGIAALLDIPLQNKPGIPTLEPVRVEVRALPKLPVPPKTGLQPEPGITLETYERVLSVIRHEARTYETTPGTYAKLDEEELRSVILAHLNGHFQGDAAGEVFRRNGKTDICIQEKNRAAFVGECKVWQGAGQVSAALDQLLGYLTWRDSKAAFVMFNKGVNDFSSILETLPKAVSEHRCFIRWLECDQPGEWRASMRSIEDEGRTVTVHVFAINIYTGTKKAGPRVRSA
jgi:hypothetical protein